ncbi:DUF4245 domain-containing protein [Pseudonocardia abyssalis]|uniref:DUF4245 domain-containing protein n=1 Tax=Pseudonocardia abyssalis TaxID=2792008 RepID=A0ABS6UW59_9PSEU|nr:DUF4245 domain-containing protein [Pseudonocardia abyssalis]MBW0116636.1 DUF4245 domain-containing protein [Pseudonocardia abyssalis]MBW0136507.1 DUF4245 domain-containing protein [Pseudonocardia abyssalis]
MTDPAPRKPPRSAMTVRDMIVAIGVLALIVVVIGGMSRGCSFSPGGPSVDPSALPVVDAPTELRALAPDVPFSLRVPAVPPGWRSNAVDQDRLDPADPAAGRAVRTGYLTTEGRYLRLVQSDGAEEAVLASEAGAVVVPAQGVTDVGGLEFVVYGAPDDEPIWIADLDGVRILITGSGAEADFQALAGAVLTGEALPAGTAPG